MPVFPSKTNVASPVCTHGGCYNSSLPYGPTHRMPEVNQSSISQLDFKTCALCAKSSNLQASHIIPGFVFDWLRETSATGHFRLSENPNLRVQDGLKPRMLCWDCEQLFASWEKTFAERCFVPINGASEPSITYGPWMLKFATSVSWRVLRSFEAAGCLSEIPERGQDPSRTRPRRMGTLPSRRTAPSRTP